ncbi:MAG: serine hydrolase domain-containing protein [Anaerolineaceae bacterium]|jgi:CubicO group peptidase (beta-lactamase class C family)|nr:serine hydrolase domain-containing protein [Anaerolineaceae bacterium]
MKKNKKWLLVLLVLLVLAAVVYSVYSNNFKSEDSESPSMSFEEALAHTTKDVPDARITVGIIHNGDVSFHVYGQDGVELPPTVYDYEIGSLTKTFTAALVNRAVSEGKIDLNESIDTYLNLPSGNYYPTVLELLTHTSGYKGSYIEGPVVGNFLRGAHPFQGVTAEMTLERLSKIHLEDQDYPFSYSNFGFATLGLVLEEVYQQEYTTLLNDFAREFGLENTRITDGQGNLSNYWGWDPGDAYMPAGAIVSTIEDMLAYAQLQLDQVEPFAICHVAQKTIEDTSPENTSVGVHLDAIGLSWFIDEGNNITWHNGGTGYFNSYLAFDPDTQIAVVVLSNLKQQHRISATVLGVKLLISLQSSSPYDSD